MKTLILLVGPPGSGKSTLAHELQKPNGYINQDLQGKEHLSLFQSMIDSNWDIIVDRMNFDRKQRDRYLAPAKAAGYKTKIIVLHQNYETCLERMRKRTDHPTIRTEESARSALNTFFTKYERPTPDEADEIEFRYPEQKLKTNAIICDLDNTLSDATHREYLLQKHLIIDGELTPNKPNWPAFFAAMDQDPLNEFCKEIINKYRDDHIIILSSGRSDSYRKVTEEWLQKHNIRYDHLFMRPRSDSRKDDLVKEIIYDFEILTRVSGVKFALDDRKQVIDKLRSRGVRVLDVAGNNF